MRKAEMMGFAEIVRQETTIKQRMIVEHGQELAAHVKRLEEVGAVLMRQAPTETVYDAARRVMMEIARLKNTSSFVEKLSAIVEHLTTYPPTTPTEWWRLSMALEALTHASPLWPTVAKLVSAWTTKEDAT